jgi:hypothetical protein
MSTPTGARAVLSAILPTPDETLLLRACLQSGDAARSAWDAWCERVGEPRTVLGAGDPARRRLLPLVLAALERSDLTATPPLRTQLRAAYLHERLRSRTVRSVCGAVIGVLRDHGVAAVVLGGAALAETAYAEPALRHCHDVDILVRSDELSRAADLLGPHGFTRLPSRGRGARGVTLEHATGLPVALHGTPFQIPYYRQPFDDVWSRGRTEMVGDVPARLPCPADQLVHVCGHASYSPSRASLQWACDAWGIIERAARIDWNLVLDVAVAARLAVPLFAMLDYLEDALDAPIPTTALRTLAKVASDTDAEGIDAALLGVVLGPRHHLRRAFQLAPDWRTRAALGRLIVVRGAARLMGT